MWVWDRKQSDVIIPINSTPTVCEVSWSKKIEKSTFFFTGAFQLLKKKKNKKQKKEVGGDLVNKMENWRFYC